MDAQQLITLLKLEPLPEEGGFYRETFRDPGGIPARALPDHPGDRAFSTCIYYLITPEAFSGLHVVRSAEVFHFYAGDAVRMIQLDEAGHLVEVQLGSDLQSGQRPQVVVPAGTWQASKLAPGGSWALLGCQVSPGFEFEDFRGGRHQELLERFPQHADVIREYTHR